MPKRKMNLAWKNDNGEIKMQKIKYNINEINKRDKKFINEYKEINKI